MKKIDRKTLKYRKHIILVTEHADLQINSTFLFLLYLKYEINI